MRAFSDRASSGRNAGRTPAGAPETRMRNRTIASTRPADALARDLPAPRGPSGRSGRAVNVGLPTRRVAVAREAESTPAKIAARPARRGCAEGAGRRAASTRPRAGGRPAPSASRAPARPPSTPPATRAATAGHRRPERPRRQAQSVAVHEAMPRGPRTGRRSMPASTPGDTGGSPAAASRRRPPRGGRTSRSPARDAPRTPATPMQERRPPCATTSMAGVPNRRVVRSSSLMGRRLKSFCHVIAASGVDRRCPPIFRPAMPTRYLNSGGWSSARDREPRRVVALAFGDQVVKNTPAARNRLVQEILLGPPVMRPARERHEADDDRPGPGAARRRDGRPGLSFHDRVAGFPVGRRPPPRRAWEGVQGRSGPIIVSEGRPCPGSSRPYP